MLRTGFLYPRRVSRTTSKESVKESQKPYKSLWVTMATKYGRDQGEWVRTGNGDGNNAQ